jgi:hypothetical protein
MDQEIQGYRVQPFTGFIHYDSPLIQNMNLGFEDIDLTNISNEFVIDDATIDSLVKEKYKDHGYKQPQGNAMGGMRSFKEERNYPDNVKYRQTPPAMQRFTFGRK